MHELNLRSQFGANTIPPLLIALEQFERRQRGWYAGDFRLSDFDGELGVVQAFGRPTAASQKLITFGRDEGGGIYGFWLFDGQPAERAPVAYICPQGQDHRIIAKDLRDFLRLLAADVVNVGAPGAFEPEPEQSPEELADDDGDGESWGAEDAEVEPPDVLTDEDDLRASPTPDESYWFDADYEDGPTRGHQPFVDWLWENNISVADDPAKLWEEAGAELPDFNRWFTEQQLALAVADEFSRATDVPPLGAEGPFLVEDETAGWRSRVSNARWEVNVCHQDYEKVSDDLDSLLQYLVILRAKECVKASDQATVDGLVDVLVQLLGD